MIRGAYLKILITGSSGQLAKEFIRYFETNSVEYNAPSESVLDITDKSKTAEIVSAYKPTHVINCAAFNLVDDAQSNPQKAFAINRDGVENLAAACSKNNAFFVHFSTDYVFDGEKNALYTEDDKPNPLNIYAQSKLEGEEKAKTVLKHLICRLSWVTGQGSQNFPYKVKQWAAGGKTLKISADEVSVPSFTFDIADACFKAIKKEAEGLFHLTNSGYASRYEFAKLYLKLKGMNNIIVPVPAGSFKCAAKRPLFTPMSNALISSALGINIPSWEESLKKYCERYDD